MRGVFRCCISRTVYLRGEVGVQSIYKAYNAKPRHDNFKPYDIRPHVFLTRLCIIIILVDTLPRRQVPVSQKAVSIYSIPCTKDRHPLLRGWITTVDYALAESELHKMEVTLKRYPEARLKQMIPTYRYVCTLVSAPTRRGSGVLVFVSVYGA